MTRPDWQQPLRSDQLPSRERPYVDRPEPLRGYRVLTDEEKALVDEIKLCEAEVGKLWAKVHEAVDQELTRSDAVRYALRAETLFRDGFMELVRAVTRPRDAYREALAELREVDRGN